MRSLSSSACAVLTQPSCRRLPSQPSRFIPLNIWSKPEVTGALLDTPVGTGPYMLGEWKKGDEWS